jgi:hypothetical protein
MTNDELVAIEQKLANQEQVSQAFVVELIAYTRALERMVEALRATIAIHDGVKPEQPAA